MNKIVIDENKCLKDGICSEVCPCRIFVADETGLAKIDRIAEPTCVGCGHCVAICPGNAISLNGVDGRQLPAVVENLTDVEAFSNLVKARRSIRSFKSDVLPVEQLTRLLEITRFAPTAKNTQALSWLIVSGRENVLKLSQAVIDVFRADERMASMVQSFDTGYDVIHRGAPQLVIAYGPEKYKWGTFDAAIAMNTFELAARAADIGTCWGGFTTWSSTLDKSIGRSLGLSDEMSIFAVMMVGRANFRYRRVPLRNELRLKVIS
ncbi:MAG: nitroreductase family protein [Candidatus Rifleibacteriota bacterium]